MNKVWDEWHIEGWFKIHALAIMYEAQNRELKFIYLCKIFVYMTKTKIIGFNKAIKQFIIVLNLSVNTTKIFVNLKKYCYNKFCFVFK